MQKHMQIKKIHSEIRVRNFMMTLTSLLLTTPTGKTTIKLTHLCKAAHPGSREHIREHCVQ